MSVIDYLIPLVSPIAAISELPDDVEEIPCKYEPHARCLKCKQCGAVSGTSREIPHGFRCPYQAREPAPAPYVLGERLISKIRMNPDLCEAILQKEFAITSTDREKKILGTYGAGPCIILCMRDRTNTNTILAHIDATTKNPLLPFLAFPPPNSDVYIIGSENSTRTQLLELLIELRNRGYRVLFAHVIDNNSNSFAIDCETGETWLNQEVRVADLPVTIDKLNRERMMFYNVFNTIALIQVRIPYKAVGHTGGGKRKYRRSAKQKYRKRRQTYRK